MLKLNNENNYEHLCNVTLTKEKFPIAFNNKVNELMEDEGISRKDAEKKVSETEIALELYYHKGHGLFAVETDAIDNGAEIYSPYNKESAIDFEETNIGMVNRLTREFDVTDAEYNFKTRDILVKSTQILENLLSIQDSINFENASSTVLVRRIFGEEDKQVRVLSVHKQGNHLWVKTLYADDPLNTFSVNEQRDICKLALEVMRYKFKK